MKGLDSTNKVPENVIVTLIWKEKNVQLDLRLPTHRVYGEWKHELLFLVGREFNCCFEVGNYDIFYNGKRILNEQTLADLAVWDGSYICLERV